MNAAPMRGRVRRRFADVTLSLGVRNYRLYFWGQLTSLAGTAMQTVAVALLVLRLTGSATDLGVTLAAEFLPFVVLGPLGGVVADRYDKRLLLFFTQTASAVIAAAFAVLTAVNEISLGSVIGLSLLLGCLTVFDNPARQSLIVELVPRDKLVNAVTLSSTSVALSRALGAALGGLLVAAAGLAFCFAVNAVSFMAVIASLAAMRTADMVTADRVPRAQGQIREGLRYARKTPEILTPLLMLAVTGVLALEFGVTLPLLARGPLHGDARTYGTISATMALGAVVGGLFTASRRGRRRATSLSVSAVGWGIAILAAAVAPDVPLECVALVFVGYGLITFNAYSKSAIQLAAEPAMRGRVMALWSLAWSGSTVVGAPLVGYVAELAGSRWALVLGGAPTLALGVLAYPALRRIDRRSDPDVPRAERSPSQSLVPPNPATIAPAAPAKTEDAAPLTRGGPVGGG